MGKEQLPQTKHNDPENNFNCQIEKMIMDSLKFSLILFM